jgi:ribosome-associated protein
VDRLETDDSTLIRVNDHLAIPTAELQFRFETSGGPGGQHANRAATRVVLLFDVPNSPSLDDVTRGRLLRRLGNRLDKNGVLQIQASDTRSQWQNRQTAITRFRLLLCQALKEQKQRRPMRPSRAAQEARLAKKKRRGAIKKERRSDWHE